MTQAQREPRSPAEAWQAATRWEKVKRMEERGKRAFLPDNGDSKSSTTGYVACVYLEEGKPTRRFQMGKPVPKSSSGDYTKRSGGPYTVDLDAGTCNCPAFVGTPGKVLGDGRILLAKDGEGECKHRYGLQFWLGVCAYELVPINGVEDRMRVRWLSWPRTG